jgi:molybdopterin converting factor subunit 1
MSSVTVQLFASCAEAFGATTLQIPLDSGSSTVEELIHRIRSLPAGKTLPGSTRLAVNRRIAAPGQRIRPTDEVAVIPPVAGG